MYNMEQFGMSAKIPFVLFGKRILDAQEIIWVSRDCFPLQK